MNVGRIVGAWGVRGWIKAQPFNVGPDSVLLSAQRWWLDAREPIDIVRARLHGATVVAQPGATLDRDAVLRMKGREIHVSRAQFRPGAPGEYYWVDLVGCEVVNPAGERFGRVADVVDHGAHPLLEVGPDASAGSEGSAPMLIPFVDRYLVEVDLAARRIVVDWERDY